MAPDRRPFSVRFAALLLAALVLSACSTLGARFGTRADVPAGSNDAAALHAALAYHRSVQRMNAAELAAERSTLAAQPQSPLSQLRQAMLLAHPQIGNLGRARALLDAVITSERSEARALEPLARVIADHVAERQRADGAADKAAQQLREAQQQRDQLQEKLDALAEIERTLPAAPLAPAPERRPAR